MRIKKFKFKLESMIYYLSARTHNIKAGHIILINYGERILYYTVINSYYIPTKLNLYECSLNITNYHIFYQCIAIDLLRLSLGKNQIHLYYEC